MTPQSSASSFTICYLGKAKTNLQNRRRVGRRTLFLLLRNRQNIIKLVN